MYSERKSENLHRLQRRTSDYVPNELVLRATREARNDDLPHFLAVATAKTPAATSYGDLAIDGILQRAGVPVSSVARVFAPATDVRNLSSLHGGFASLAAAVSSQYDEREDVSGLSRTYKVTLEAETNVPALCDRLKASRAVEDARPNFFREVFAPPNDEFYGFQWGLQAIGIEAAWATEAGHPDLVIAIVDSGADLDHEDLGAKLLPGFDFVDFRGSGGRRYRLLGDYRNRDNNPNDEDGHGSHCAGIAAAATNNSLGVAGVCPGGRILPVRVMFRVYDRFTGSVTSVGTDADIDAGIKFAVDAGAHVINLSLGGPEPSHAEVLEFAHDRNVCVLAATGNENTSAASYPASNARTLAVGAVDQNRNRASFSNYGPAYNRFVMAPGVQIASTYKDNDYVYLQGTSMATPFVTGLAGLIVSLALRRGGQLPADVIYDVIRDTAVPLGAGKGDTFFGEGLIDPAAALQTASARL